MVNIISNMWPSLIELIAAIAYMRYQHSWIIENCNSSGDKGYLSIASPIDIIIFACDLNSIQSCVWLVYGIGMHL